MLGGYKALSMHPSLRGLKVPLALGTGALACLFESHGHEPPSHAPLLVAFNPDPLDQPLSLPPGRWSLALDSSGELPVDPASQLQHALIIPQRSLLLLRRLAPGDPAAMPFAP